jgi:hypothetical protein
MATSEALRGFPAPWRVEEGAESFCVRDAVFFEDEHGRRMAMNRLTRDKVRHVAEHFVKLPDLLRC